MYVLKQIESEWWPYKGFPFGVMLICLNMFLIVSGVTYPSIWNLGRKFGLSLNEMAAMSFMMRHSWDLLEYNYLYVYLRCMWNLYNMGVGQHPLPQINPTKH